MGEHDTWFHLIPGVRGALDRLGEAIGGGYLTGEKIHGLPHVIMAVFVFGLILYVATRYRARLSAAPDEGIIPERTLNARGVVEILCDVTLGMMSGVMGDKAARKFLPLIGTLAFFILFSNLMGLIPGFLPATDTLSTTAACAIIVFFATHIYGLKVNGFGHIKHLFGPVWWLGPLMFPIEVVSHLARPLSLSLRLMGNMVGDHKVLAIFLGLVPFIVPIPILVLGTIVCVVQALVFCLLSVVYIGLAIEEHHHEEGAH